MARNGVNLTTRQRRALNALLAQPTIRSAAKKCGIAERTLWRYLAKPAFVAELRRRQDAVLLATTSAMVGMAGNVVAVLEKVLADPDASDSVKVRAALGWLAQARRQVELDDLVRRIEDLEANRDE